MTWAPIGNVLAVQDGACGEVRLPAAGGFHAPGVGTGAATGAPAGGAGRANCAASGRDSASAVSEAPNLGMRSKLYICHYGPLVPGFAEADFANKSLFILFMFLDLRGLRTSARSRTRRRRECGGRASGRGFVVPCLANIVGSYRGFASPARGSDTSFERCKDLSGGRGG